MLRSASAWIRYAHVLQRHTRQAQWIANSTMAITGGLDLRCGVLDSVLLSRRGDCDRVQGPLAFFRRSCRLSRLSPHAP
jgi:hypothetical protein